MEPIKPAEKKCRKCRQKEATIREVIKRVVYPAFRRATADLKRAGVPIAETVLTEEKKLDIEFVFTEAVDWREWDLRDWSRSSACDFC
jgi:hypothetical protein